MFGFGSKKKEYAVPELAWLLEQGLEHTPDIWKLQQYQAQLVFVYDETMLRHRRHNLMGNHDPKWPVAAWTHAPFNMWKKQLGKASYPIALRPHFITVPSATIKGELYAVTAEVISELDKYKKNGVYFERIKVPIVVPYRNIMWLKNPPQDQPTVQSTVITQEKRRTVRAWMYVGIPDVWEKDLDGGYFFTPVKTYAPKAPWFTSPYYYFSRLEYDV